MTHIHLQDNALTLDRADCETIGGLYNLVELNLSGNLITSWPFMSSKESPNERNENLAVLDLSRNYKMILPHPNTHMLNLHTRFPKLIHLDLSGVPIQEGHIDGDISTMTSLQELVLESCSLTVFPTSLFKLKSLLRLSLRSNSINKLPDEIVALKNLLSLDVSNNDLSHLPLSLGLMSDTLRTLLVEGNPLRTIRRTIVAKGTTGNN